MNDNISALKSCPYHGEIMIPIPGYKIGSTHARGYTHDPVGIYRYPGTIINFNGRICIYITGFDVITLYKI